MISAASFVLLTSLSFDSANVRKESDLIISDTTVKSVDCASWSVLVELIDSVASIISGAQ